jgi:hypothetical protein
MCVLIFSTILSETFLILRGIERDIIINVHRSSCKVPVILVSLSRNSNFLDRLSKNRQKSNFMKIRRVEAELFHADGRTGITKLIVAARNFANAPKKTSPRSYQYPSSTRERRITCHYGKTHRRAPSASALTPVYLARKPLHLMA